MRESCLFFSLTSPNLFHVRYIILPRVTDCVIQNLKLRNESYILDLAKESSSILI